MSKVNINFSDASKIGEDIEKTNQQAYEESHGKLYDMTHKNTVPWRNWIFYIALISMLTCCFTFSKYVSSSSGSSSAVIAKFEVDCAHDITATVKMDDNKTYPVMEFAGGIFATNGGSSNSKTATFTAKNSSEVAVYLTWETSGASSVTATLARKTSDSRDASATKLYIPAATTQNGELIPSTRQITLTVTPNSSGNGKEKLNISFKFDQVD